MATARSSADIPPKSAADKARKGSNEGTLFAGLLNQKRASESSAAAARRASFHDQKPQAGVLGQMWNNFTKGPVDK